MLSAALLVRNKLNGTFICSRLQGALRASVNRQTGFTAYRLMLGREVNMPAHLIFPHTGEKCQNIDSYVTSLTTNLEKAHDTARNSLKTPTKRVKRNYDLRLLEHNYEVGDIVHILGEISVKGQCSKLRPPWKGPGIIIRKFSSYLFKIVLHSAIMVLNNDRIILCKNRTPSEWITQWKDNPKAEEDILSAGKEYCTCICRKPLEGRFIIQCDDSDEWYHGSYLDKPLQMLWTSTGIGAGITSKGSNRNQYGDLACLTSLTFVCFQAEYKNYCELTEPIIQEIVESTS